MNTNDVSKLPKWAQDHIRSIQGERDVAVRELNEWVDGQTEAAMWIDEMVSLGERRVDGSNPPSHKRRYVQTRRIDMKHLGVKLGVSLRDDGIRLQWTVENGSLRNVAMIPDSYQAVVLVTKENMQ